jgi:UDP-3-O-[3-hydroxymyristoyl] glucosamine N-acyltransferase
VVLGGRTGVNNDITESGVYFGTPPKPLREGQRIMMAQQRVPELLQRVKDLERRLQELEGKQ